MFSEMFVWSEAKEPLKEVERFGAVGWDKLENKLEESDSSPNKSLKSLTE